MKHVKLMMVVGAASAIATIAAVSMARPTEIPGDDKDGGKIALSDDKDGGKIVLSDDKDGGKIVPGDDKDGGKIALESATDGGRDGGY
ncbi:MAG: hypothetical protein FWD73_00665 [Polyangiaceae bacterium]|nr:hypothetical protein [Polyangiaceae bacterium]